MKLIGSKQIDAISNKLSIIEHDLFIYISLFIYTHIYKVKLLKEK